MSKDFYTTWKEAAIATRQLHIKDKSDYGFKRKKDKKLPPSPKLTYANEWEKNGGWNNFCKVKKYVLWEEASRIAQELGITKSEEYRNRHFEDNRLPTNPNITYAHVWKEIGGMKGFLGTQKDKQNIIKKPHKKTRLCYSTWKGASTATQKLGIKTSTEYKKRYKEDRLLPSNPYKKYSTVWKKNGGWPEFLKTSYQTWEEASLATIQLGIKNRTEYLKKYKNDPLLPSNPWKKYKKDWKENHGWSGFLFINMRLSYSTWEKASVAAQNLGIKTSKEYKERYKEDKLLPSNLYKKYSTVWKKNGSWAGFLGKLKK
jgi:hypothetical protein